MKRVSVLFSLLLIIVGLVSCSELTAYDLEDFIPPLMNMETQYPYVEKIIVTDTGTGESAEFTEWAEHNKIRMIFEELKCARREKSPETDKGYRISFVTVNETVEIFVPVEDGAYQARYVYIGEYEFEPLANGVDTFYFASLFAE